MIKKIMEDERKIQRIEIFTQHAGDIVSYSRRDGFTEIIPYHENGEMAPVVWFAVSKDGKVVSRINGKFVQVIDYC